MIPPPPGKPQVSPADLVISIITIVVLATCGVAAAAMGFMMLAFTDYCPVQTCNIDGAVTAMGIAFVVGLTVAVAGTVVTIVRLVRRRTAWTWALGTLMTCGVIALTGFVGYLAAVGDL